MESLKLSDDTIGKIAQALQMALLTGTDVVDNLRSIRLVNNNGLLDPCPEFLATWESNIQKMIEEAEAAPAADDA